MLLEGLHIPLTTPFHPDGRLNLPKLAANIARYSKSPAAGLIVLGPGGEPTLLSDDDTREVLRPAAEAAAPEKVLIAGISRDSVSATLDLANFAAAQGYDAALVGPPSIATDDRELLIYFQAVADRTTLPIVLLSVDSEARSISTDAIVELAAHPNVIGLLSGDSAAITAVLARTAQIKRDVTVTSVFAAVTARSNKTASSHTTSTLVSAATLTGAATAIAEPPPLPALRTRTRTVGFQILTGDTQGMLASLHAGAD